MAAYSETLNKLINGEDVDATDFRNFAMALKGDPNRKTEIKDDPEEGLLLEIFRETPHGLLATLNVSPQQARLFGYVVKP